MLDVARDRLERSAGLQRGDLDRLQSSTVAVIGAGVIGGQLIRHLALLGVGLVIADSDEVGVENTANQGFCVSSIGEPKSVARVREVHALNPECRVTAVHRRFEDLGHAALQGIDLVLCALDGPAARVRLNEACFRLGIPWIDGAVDGSGRWMVGTVTAFQPLRGDSPCYLCDMDAASLLEAVREARGPGCPSWRRPDTPVTLPTLQSSAFAAVVAGLQAVAAIRMLRGRGGDALVGRQWVVEVQREPRVRTLRVDRNPRCVFDHEPFGPLRETGDDTVGGLLETAARDLGGDPELILHHRALVLHLVCDRCGRRREVARVADEITDEEIACGCEPGAELRPSRLLERIGPSEGRLLRRLRWAEIGIPPRDVVTARRGERRLHYIVRGAGDVSRSGAEAAS